MRTLFLDIETTGLSRYSDDVTSIVWHYDGEWHNWVNGVDSHILFERHWKESEELVTYNGKCFDEPFICKKFELFKHPKHLDLRFYLARLGLKGGLKLICQQLELKRSMDLADIDGRDAVTFWKRYQKGDQKALDALIYYNAWDVLLLKMIYTKYVSPSFIAVDPPYTHDKGWLRDYISGKTDKLPESWTSPFSEDKTASLVKLNTLTQVVNKDGPSYGDVICFTGSLVDSKKNKITRSQARNLANRNGFVWTEEVVEGCTHLVTGDISSTSRKALKARKLGITMYSPDDFFEALNEGSKLDSHTIVNVISNMTFPKIIDVQKSRPVHTYAQTKDEALITLNKLIKENDYLSSFLTDHRMDANSDWTFCMNKPIYSALDIVNANKKHTISLSDENEKEYTWQEWQQGSNFSFKEGDVLHTDAKMYTLSWDMALDVIEYSIQIESSLAAIARPSMRIISPLKIANATSSRQLEIIKYLTKEMTFQELQSIVKDATKKDVSLETIERMANRGLLTITITNSSRDPGLVIFNRFEPNSGRTKIEKKGRYKVTQDQFVEYLISGSINNNNNLARYVYG
jgi:hypothetical protein